MRRWAIQPTRHASSKRCRDAATASLRRRGCSRRRARRAGATKRVDGRPTYQPAALPRRIGKATAIAVASLIVLVGAIALFRRPGDQQPAAPGRAAHETGRQESWPAFAPDGDQVAFAWSGEKYDNTDIYVTLVGSTDVRRLTTDAADDFAPSWSPDGRRIAFLRKVRTLRADSRHIRAGWARREAE